MLESIMNMSAFAPTLNAVTTSPLSLGVARDQRDSAVPDSPVAQRTFSLAMIREAFKGLLVTTERLYSSSAEQRAFLSTPSVKVDRSMDNPLPFKKKSTPSNLFLILSKTMRSRPLRGFGSRT